MPCISGFISALHFQRVANTTLPHKHSYRTICAFKTHTWCRVGMESVSNALSIPPRLPLHIPLQSRKYSPISTIHQPSLPICRSLRGPLVSHILKALFIRRWSGKVCASRARARVCVCIYACVRQCVAEAPRVCFIIDTHVWVLFQPTDTCQRNHTAHADVLATISLQPLFNKVATLQLLSTLSTTALRLKHLFACIHPHTLDAHTRTRTSGHFYCPDALLNGSPPPPPD